MFKTKIAVAAALILGATSGAFADVTENKIGDIYPAQAAVAHRHMHDAYAMARPSQHSFVAHGWAQEKALFDRVGASRW